MTTDYYTQLPQIRLGDFTGRSVQPETTAEVMLDGDDVRRFGAKPDKKIVDRQAASPSSWKTPRMAIWMAA